MSTTNRIPKAKAPAKPMATFEDTMKAFLKRKDDAELQQFLAAYDRARNGCGKVVLVELNRLEAAALELCAKEHNEGNAQEYTKGALLAQLEGDVDSIRHGE